MSRSPRLVSALLCTCTAALAATLYGLAEAGHVTLAATFFKDSSAVVALLLVGALSTGLCGAVLGFFFGLLLGQRYVRARRAWWSFLLGIFAMLLWDMAVRWFADPPPFQDPFPFQGNTTVFAVIAALCSGGGIILGWRIRGRKPVFMGTVVILLLLFVRVGTGLGFPAARGEPQDGMPNVLWVTLDTTRADHIGAYGSRVSTPNFDTVAAQGVLFMKAFAQIAVTGPSHGTMLTGTGPWGHGVLLNGVPIPDDIPTLPELLRAHGYRCGAFVSAYVLDGDLGFSRGFDVYDDEFGWVKGSGALLPFRTTDMLRRHFFPDEVVERRAQDTVDAALQWLDGRQAPWFLWVHLFDPHGPYEPRNPMPGHTTRATPGIPGTSPWNRFTMLLRTCVRVWRVSQTWIT